MIFKFNCTLGSREWCNFWRVSNFSGVVWSEGWGGRNISSSCWNDDVFGG